MNKNLNKYLTVELNQTCLPQAGWPQLPVRPLAEIAFVHKPDKNPAKNQFGFLLRI